MPLDDMMEVMMRAMVLRWKRVVYSKASSKSGEGGARSEERPGTDPKFRPCRCLCSSLAPNIGDVTRHLK